MKRIERFLMNMPLVLISKNELLRRMLWQKRIKNKLKKYFVIHSKPSCVSTLNQQSKVIWWLWYQGSKNAPEIVKMCLSSVKHYAEIMNYAVIELDEKNLFEYVNLPEKLISKWKSGKIGAANFSDIIRVDLLANRGGVWMDSTVYLSGLIDSELLDSEMFLYKASFCDASITKISSWLMIAKNPGNPYFVSLRDSLIKYWEESKYGDDYYILHLFAASISEIPKFKAIFDGMPYRSNTYPQILATKLNIKYCKAEIDLIFKHSSVHKLTYKGVDEKSPDTVFQFLRSANIES